MMTDDFSFPLLVQACERIRYFGDRSRDFGSGLRHMCVQKSGLAASKDSAATGGRAGVSTAHMLGRAIGPQAAARASVSRRGF